MKHTNRMIVLVLSFLVMFCVAALSGQDWPQWRGANRDGRVEGFKAPDQWPAQLTQKWSVPVGTGAATPALVGDKLYVFSRQGDQEMVLCLNAADGKELWKAGYAAQAVTGPAGRHPGPRSSPAVADGKVVTLGVGGVISCLNAADGKEIWRKDPFPQIVPRFFTAVSPILADGMAVAQLGGQGNGAIIAFDLATGDVKWQWTEEGPEYASPVLLTVEGTKQIAALTEKSIVGIGLADGKLLWKLPFVPEGRSYNSVTPIVDGPMVIYSGAERGTCAVKIEKQEAGFAAKELWKNPEVSARYNTPVLHDGWLYGISDKGSPFCLNAQTGQTAWTDPNQLDKGGFSSLVDGGTVLLVLPSSGDLIVFEPNPKEYKQKAALKVSQTPVYAYPVIADNRIFIKDQDNLTLWTIE
jgi:outer membrane protein assembly factor BamB